jgi:hypothetical protein
MIFQTAKRLGYFASLVLALPKPSCFVSRNYKIAKRKSTVFGLAKNK